MTLELNEIHALRATITISIPPPDAMNYMASCSFQTGRLRDVNGWMI
jgi:hypothetical protein